MELHVALQGRHAVMDTFFSHRTEGHSTEVEAERFIGLVLRRYILLVVAL
jgi:hypothetical protein